MSNYEKFKKRGPFRMEKALVAVLIAIITVLIIIPRSERESKIEKETSIIFVESIEIPQVQLKEMDIPAPRPAIPVISEDEEIDISITIADMVFEDYPDDVPPPPKDPNADSRIDTFYVFDEPPHVIGSISDNLIYPSIPQEAGIEGTVIVQSFIDDKGVVRECVVLKGLPGTGLDEAAMDAIKKTKFIPAQQRDRSVGVWIAIPVTFKLNTR
jgi:periplasmic protein TonB